MTRRHTVDYYMDNYVPIEFCKICSAEGDRLLEECQGPIASPVLYFRNLTREEFEAQYKKALDQSNQTAK
jgi:hypothetical protein